ncbi:MAG: DUF421 domain-containing protein [Caldilineaceae bacterium]|nr:DUF421 domain-containing protein [Caldilineaceae bacterium]
MSDPASFQLFDLHRMFVGDLPWTFTLEVIARTVIMYVYTLLLIRLLSRRAIGQLSLIEFALVIALGSAVGDPMFYPDVPLLHGFAVVTTVVVLNRGINWLMARHDLVERVVEGRPATLVQDGRLLMPNLRRFGLSHDELFEFLRSQGVENLGTIRAAYFEQNGQISVFPVAPDEAHIGLRIVPPMELSNAERFVKDQFIQAKQVLACQRCGYTQTFQQETLPLCPICQHDGWTPAAPTSADRWSKSVNAAPA